MVHSQAKEKAIESSLKKLSKQVVVSATFILVVIGFVEVTSRFSATDTEARSFNQPGTKTPLAVASLAVPKAPKQNAAQTPTIQPVEQVQLPSCDKNAVSLYNSYSLIFQRLPNSESGNYWLDQLSNGTPVTNLVDSLLTSSEAVGKYGETNDISLLAEIYKNKVGQPPTGNHLETWQQQLAAGQTKGQIIVDLANHQTIDFNREYVLPQSFCDFVSSHGGGTQVAPGVVLQQQGREHVTFIDLSKVAKALTSPQGSGLQTTHSFANNNGLTVAINANWYRANGALDGFAVSNGKVYGGNRNPDTGKSGDHDYTALFGLTAEFEPRINWHGETYDAPPADVENAISGHPSLTHKGLLSSDYGFALGPDSRDVYTLVTKHAHSAIGVSEDNKVLIMASVDGRSGGGVGYTALELAQMMQRVGAYESVMLDGSGSTSLVIKGTEVTSSSDRSVLVNFGVQTGTWFE